MLGVGRHRDRRRWLLRYGQSDGDDFGSKLDLELVRRQQPSGCDRHRAVELGLCRIERGQLRDLRGASNARRWLVRYCQSDYGKLGSKLDLELVRRQQRSGCDRQRTVDLDVRRIEWGQLRVLFGVFELRLQ
jgi:hypothetical protein